MHTRFIYSVLLGTLWVAHGGCLSSEEPSSSYDMCQSTEECTGEAICDIGVCWGNPPDTSQFALVLSPPVDRPDLAPAELDDISIASDGTISGLEFTDTIQLHGRIVLGCAPEQSEGCGELALIPAQVIVERASTFKGGPTYRRSVLTNPEAAPEEDSFSISLPRDGQEYRVTVLPVEGASLGSIASLGDEPVQAPPFALVVEADDDLEVAWEIGKPEQLKKIEGCITNALGNGRSFYGMHITALGRWMPSETPTRASSIVTTDEEGCFELAVPIDMLNTFDIVAKPGPGLTLPTLRLSGEEVPDPGEDEAQLPHVLEPLVMPNAANPVTFKLPLYGLSSGGAPEPISGATLIMDTIFDLPLAEERDIVVSFSAQATSNGIGEPEEGIAVVQLYPGSYDENRSYKLKVLSPPDSEFASVFDARVEVGTGEGAPVLEGLALERRVAVTGQLVTSEGEALADTPITVRPSPLLRRILPTTNDRAVLDNLQASTVLSGPSGEFLVWLDAELVGQPAQYSLEMAPPDFSSAPRWTFKNIRLDSSKSSRDTVDLGSLQLPAASFARGDIRDSEGHLVIGAEARWYQIPSDDDCGSVNSCDIPARLLGIWGSGESGECVAVLPILPE